MLAGSALIEGVERMNVVIVCSNQRAVFTQHNLYAIDVDRGNRNCYSCREYGYLAQNCRRQNIGQGRRVEYKDNKNYRQNNLNRERDLIVLN